MRDPDVNAPSNSATGARRRVLLIGLLTVLVVAAICASLVWPRSSAITRENEAGFHEGMSWDELKVILGGPPRDVSTGPTELDPGAPMVRIGRPLPPSVTRIYEWISDEVLIRVAFDADGRAEWITTCPLRRTFFGRGTDSSPLAAPAIARPGVICLVKLLGVGPDEAHGGAHATGRAEP
jgi:hypothetical protein